MPHNLLIGCSAHVNADQLLCNIINTSPYTAELKAGQVIGSVSVIDDANSQFDKMVSNFYPLDVEKVRTIATTQPFTYSEELRSMTANSQLNDLQRRMLLVVLKIHENVFQWDSKGLGRTKLLEHHVKTTGPPIQQRQYPIPTVAMEEIRAQTAKMLKENVIRPSNSPWRSPVLLVKKKDSGGNVVGHRFCIDLTKVNAVTVKDAYALPLIGRTVDTLSGAKFFSNGDLDRAFWQVGIKEEDKKKFAFVIDGQLFEPNVMPFGSMNAPSTFQRLVDRVLHGLTWRQCLIYLDDVLIFSATFEKHLCDIHEILSRFEFANLRLKPSKCNSANGIQATLKKLEAMSRIEPPTLTKNLYTFLCSLTYYRKHIPLYGELTERLYKMCEAKKAQCQWDAQAIKAFAAVKQAFLTAPILRFPNYKLPFIIHCDASNVAISAVLLQQLGELLHPNEFASRKLTPTERRYSVSERELLAIVYAYDQFYHHVYGRRIEFYTDHKPLVTMQELKNPHGRLGRLFHKLSGVDYRLNYIPGPENFLADFLSRSFNLDSEKASVNAIAFKTSIDWAAEQQKDEEILNVSKYLALNLPDERWHALSNGKRWFREIKHLYFDNEILMYGNDRVVVPRHKRSEVLAQHHDSPFKGHRGFETTILSIRKRYFWFCMTSQVLEYCRSCPKCQTFNYACLHNRAPMKPIVVSRPWQLLGIDFMGPLKTTSRGNSYIVLAVDHFTKYIEGAATPSFNALITANFVMSNIICRYGMVEQIFSDQGANFESHLFKHLCVLLGTHKFHSSAYHPEGNGITERPNKTIKPNLAKYVNDGGDDWDLFLPLAISAYNNSYHSTVKVTPYEAIFGRPSVQVTDILLSNQLPSSTKLRDVAEYIKAIRLNADYINSHIRSSTTAAQARQKKYYDRFVKDKATFKVGDHVKIKNFTVRPGHSKAFEPKFLGPYLVTELLGDLNYRLEGDNMRQFVVHYNRMSHFQVREGSTRLSTQLVSKTAPVNARQAASVNARQSPANSLKRSERLRNKQPTSYFEFDSDVSSDDLALDPTPAEEDSDVSMLFAEAAQRPSDEQVEQAADHLETIDQAAIESSTLIPSAPAPSANPQADHYATPPEPTSLLSEDEDSVEPPLNSKGKPTAKCVNCGNYYEKVTGLRIHLYSCKPTSPTLYS